MRVHHLRSAKRVGKLTTTRITPITTDQGANAKVLAAGTLPWRMKGGKLQVLLIHRPAFDDWSWPKGRLGSRETLPETAWRETKEEIGLKLTLGIPLGVIRYKNPRGKNRKEVWYWAAHVREQKPAVDHQEVDATRWATVEEARELLTKAVDQQPLDVLHAAFKARQLATDPLIVVRQAKPIPSESWTQDEVDRPLADSGYTQAQAVARLLRAWKPTRIVTSTYTRSLETIAPYAKRYGGAVRAKKWLNVKAIAARPEAFRRRLSQEFKRHETALLCSQPVVVKQILREIRQWVKDGDALIDPKSVVAKKKSNLSPSSILVVHRAQQLGGRVVSVECYDPLIPE